MKFFRLAALVVAALSAVAATAQIPTSTHDIVPSSRRPPRSDVALTDQVFRDLVGCVIGLEPIRTRNLLSTIPGTHAESRILGSFQSRMEHCYDDYRTGGRALVYAPNLLRGVIAETYYAREVPAGIAPASDITAELAMDWANPRASDGRVTQMEMIHAMARCVTVRQPAAVAALLRALPLSAEERAAFQPLQADLSACLDSGVEFEASRQSLRALLAEAAFHYAQASRNGFAAASPAATASRSD